MKKTQQGISLVEILIATALSTVLFALLVQSGRQMRDSYLAAQSYNYRQSVLLDGWWKVTEHIKRVSSANTYYPLITWDSYSKTTAYLIAARLNSATNNIIFTDADLIGQPNLPLAYRTLSKSSPSNVDIPSDQLVIQYTVVQKNQVDCEGAPITPRSKTPTVIRAGETPVIQTVIERYYVKDTGKQLNLMCDALRYDKDAGFTGDTVGERVMVPNIDYFHAMFSDRYTDPFYYDIDQVYETLAGRFIYSYSGTNIENSLQKSNASNRLLTGVEISMLYHAPYVANTGATPTPAKNSFAILNNQVTLNGGATTDSAIYDVATSFIALNYYKRAD